MSADPREDIALFRFRVIGEATNPRLTPAERGHVVRELANQAHLHPDGSEWTYSRVTLDRWIRAYREHGLDGLRPPLRADLGIVRRHPELLEEACQLRLELPGRSAAQIAAILKARRGTSVPERTIRSICLDVVCTVQHWLASHAHSVASKPNGPMNAGWATYSSVHLCPIRANREVNVPTCSCSWMTSVGC